MNITIEPNGNYAIYEQIVGQIKDQILNGTLAADEALPSIRKLAAEVGVSVITTKRAYEELEKEGLIRSVANKGFYVCRYNSDYLREKQLVELETLFSEAIGKAENAGLSRQEILIMVEGLL